MSRKIKDLIKILKEEEQDKDVEFIVVGSDGMMVCMDVEMKANKMVDLLTMFGDKS